MKHKVIKKYIFISFVVFLHLFVINNHAKAQYCSSSSTNANYEYIERVNIVGAMDNTSGAQAYTDFTGIIADLTANTTYDINLTPGFQGTIYSEYWRVWIDYNNDGDFDDAGELVFEAGPSTTTVSGTIDVSSQTVQNTRMRVSMKFNGWPTTCETFEYGEVEDYTVNITAPPNSLGVKDIIAKKYSTCNISNRTIEVEIENTTAVDQTGFEVSLLVENPDNTQSPLTKTYNATLAAGAPDIVEFSVNMTQTGQYIMTADVDMTGVTTYGRTEDFIIRSPFGIPFDPDFSDANEQSKDYWDLGNYTWDTGTETIRQNFTGEDDFITPAISINQDDYYLTYRVDPSGFSGNYNVKVQIGTACSETYTTIDEITQTSDGTYNTYAANYQGYLLNQNYDGQNIQLRFVVNFDVNNTFVLEDLWVRSGNNLMISEIVKEEHLACGTDQYEFSVVVRNIAPKTQTNIGVDMEVYNTANSETFSETITSLAFNQETEILMGTFDASAEGIYELIAEVNLDNDYDTDDNRIVEALEILPPEPLPYILTNNFDQVTWGPYTTDPLVFFTNTHIGTGNIDEGETASFVTPKLGPVTENSKLAISYNVNTDDANDDLGDQDYVIIEVSSGCGGNFVELSRIGRSDYDEEITGYQLSPTIDLSDYLGQEIVVRISAQNGASADQTSYIRFFVDQIHVGPADIKITGIDLSQIDRWCGNPTANIDVHVENNSIVDANNIPTTLEIANAGIEDITETKQLALAKAQSVDILAFGTYNLTQKGKYDLAAYTEYLNDADVSNDRMDGDETTIYDWIPTPYAEDFLYDDNPNVSAPKEIGWDLLTNEFNYHSGGYLNGNGLIYSEMSEGDHFEAISPLIGPIADGDFLAFNFSVKAYDSFWNYLGEYTRVGDTIFVYASNDCGSQWDLLYTINNGNYSNPEEEYTYISNIDLSGYVGEKVRFRFVSEKLNPVGISRFAVDDFHVISSGDVGVTAMEFNQYTSNIAICGSSNDSIDVTVKNFGRGSISNVPVVVEQIYEEDTLSLSGTIAHIDPGMEETITIAGFNTIETGEYDFIAHTLVEGDIDNSNDEMDPGVTLNVQNVLTIPNYNPGNTTYNMWQYYHDESEAVWASNGTQIETPMLNEGDTAFMTVQKVGLVKDGYKLRISYIVEAYDAQETAPELVGNYLRQNDTIFAQVSTECGQTFNNLNTITSSNHPDTDGVTELVLDLDAFYDEEIVVRLWAKKGQNGQMKVLYEAIDFTIPQPDLVLDSVFTEDEICGKAEEPIYAIITNASVYNEELTNFVLKADVAVDGDLNVYNLTTTYAETLLPGQTDTVEIGTIDASLPADYDVTVYANYDADVNPANNDNVGSEYRFTIYEKEEVEIVDNGEVTELYDENFDTNPMNWKARMRENFAWKEENRFQALDVNANETAWLYSPKIGTLGAYDNLEFDYSFGGTFDKTDSVKVYLSNDCGANWSMIHVISNPDNLSNYAATTSTANIPLTAYADQDVIFKINVVNMNGNAFTVDIDNFKITRTDVAVLGIVNETDIFDINLYDPNGGVSNYIERYITCGDANDELFVVFENKGSYDVNGVDIVLNITGKTTGTLTESYNKTLKPGEKDWLSMGTVDSQTPGLLDMEAVITIANDAVPENNAKGFSVTTQNVYELPYDAFNSEYFNEAYFWKCDEDGEMAADTASGIFGITPNLAANSLDKDETATAVTPKLSIDENAWLYFDYYVNNSLNEGHIIHNEMLEIAVITDCGTVEDQIWSMDVNDTDLAANGTLGLDLTAYSGNDIQLVFRASKGDSDGLFSAAFDNIDIYDYAPVNAGMKSDGEIMPSGSQFCETDVINLFNTTPDIANWSYEWEFTNADTSFILDGSNRTYSVEDFATGDFTLYAYSAHSPNIKYVSQPISVVVNKLPETATLPAGATIIENRMATNEYTITPVQDATSYLWDIKQGGTISGDTDTVTVYWNDNFQGYTQIKVQGQNDCGVGPWSDPLNVLVQEPVSIFVTDDVNANQQLTEYTYCEGTSLSLKASNGFDLYKWMKDTQDETNAITTSQSLSLDLTADDAGTYHVRAVKDDYVSYGQVTINVSPYPAVPSDIAGNTEIVSNLPTEIYSVDPIANADNYLWQLSDGGTLIFDENEATIYWEEGFVGNVELSVVGQNNCGLGEAANLSIYFQYYAPVNAGMKSDGEIMPSGSQFCEKDVINLFNTTPDIANWSYEWEFTNADTSFILDGSNRMYSVEDFATGDFTLYAYSMHSPNIKYVSQPISVVVNKLPETATLPAGATIIENRMATNEYTTTPVQDATSYLWDIKQGGTISGDTDTVTVYWNDNFQGYTQIKVQGQNDCGVGPWSDPLNVLVQEPVSIFVTDDVNANQQLTEYTYCEGTSLSLKASNGFDLYKWMKDTQDETNAITTSQSLSLDLTADDAGTYHVRAVKDDYVSYGQVTINVSPYPAVPSDIAGNTEIVSNLPTEIYSVDPIANADNYLWQLSDGGTLIFDENEATIYWEEGFVGNVELSVVGQNNCGLGEAANLSIYIQYLVGDNDKSKGKKEIGNTASINEISIYPNPTNGAVKIVTSEPSKIFIYNQIGSLVSKTVNFSATSDFNMSDLSNGTYIVKVVTESSVATRKIKLIK